MSARSRRGGGGRRRRGGHDGGHADDERWLLTYADMITLLMALFMVLFSISSVNTSKFEALKATLNDAFSGAILQGGQTIKPDGGTKAEANPVAQPPVPAISLTPADINTFGKAKSKDAAKAEQEELKRLKAMIDRYVRENGLQAKVQTEIARRGLVIRLLTDNVLFSSGEAKLKPQSFGLLSQIGRIINLDGRHPVVVEGHTDNVPIATDKYPSNWELSGGRSASVVRFLIGRGVLARRLEAAGYADLRPRARNTIETGRSANRRVEIVLLRIASSTSTGGISP